MPSLQIKADGSWKKIKPHVNIGGSWKKIKNAYINIGGEWKKTYSGATLPIGIILPYASNDTVPLGFSEFADANDKLIVGAGGGKSVGDIGGSTSLSISGTTSSNGLHLGSSFDGVGYLSNGGSVTGSNDISSGNHNHTFSGSTTAMPENKTMKLIKATEELDIIPLDVCIFASSTITGLVAEESSNRYLKPNSSYNVISGNNTVTISGTTSFSGFHDHKTFSYASKTEDGTHAKTINKTLGGHPHSFSASGNINLKYKYLSLWKSAIADNEIGDNQIIGMWEGDVAPDGWVLCDGTNDTPDMRDYFLRLGDDGNKGASSEGSATINMSGSTSNGGPHDHEGSSLSNTKTTTAYHSNTISMAGHTFSATPTYTPPYYALTFIMKQI